MVALWQQVEIITAAAAVVPVAEESGPGVVAPITVPTPGPLRSVYARIWKPTSLIMGQPAVPI